MIELKLAVPRMLSEHSAFEGKETGCKRLVTVALSPVRVAGQILQELHELAGLTDEKAVSCQCLHSTHGHAFGFGRTNNRAGRKLATQKRRRLGHDQVGLKVLSPKWRRIQIRERNGDTGDGIDNIRDGHHVSCFVLPGLEVADFSSPDAEQDAKNLGIRGSLRQGRIETAAALLDPGKVKACGVGNDLQESGVGNVRVGPGNCSVLPDSERGNGVPEGIA